MESSNLRSIRFTPPCDARNLTRIPTGAPVRAGHSRNFLLSSSNLGDYDSATGSDIDEMFATNKALASQLRTSRYQSSSSSEYDDEVFSLPPSAAVAKSQFLSRQQQQQQQQKQRPGHRQSLVNGAREETRGGVYKLPHSDLLCRRHDAVEHRGRLHPEINKNLENGFAAQSSRSLYGDSKTLAKHSAISSALSTDETKFRNKAFKIDSNLKASTKWNWPQRPAGQSTPLRPSNRLFQCASNVTNATLPLSASQVQPDPQDLRQPQQQQQSLALVKRRSVLNINTSQLLDKSGTDKPVLQRPVSAHFEWVSSISGGGRQFFAGSGSGNYALDKGFSSNRLGKFQPLNTYCQSLPVIRSAATRAHAVHKFTTPTAPSLLADRASNTIACSSSSGPAPIKTCAASGKSWNYPHTMVYNINLSAPHADNSISSQMNLPSQPNRYNAARQQVNQNHKEWRGLSQDSYEQHQQSRYFHQQHCNIESHTMTPTLHTHRQSTALKYTSKNQYLSSPRQEQHVLKLVPHGSATRVKNTPSHLHSHSSNVNRNTNLSGQLQAHGNTKGFNPDSQPFRNDNGQSTAFMWINATKTGSNYGGNTPHTMSAHQLQNRFGGISNEVPHTNFAVNRVVNITNNRIPVLHVRHPDRRQPSTLILQRPWTIHICDDEDPAKYFSSHFSEF